MTTSSVSSSQDHSSALEEAQAAISGNYQEMVDYQNGIDNDQEMIAYDQEQIDAQTLVQDTHYGVDAEGNTYVYYTYHEENVNSDTQIQIYQNDIDMREANQAELQENFDDSSDALQELAGTLSALFMLNAGNGKSGGGRNVVNDLKEIMENLRDITQEMMLNMPVTSESATEKSNQPRTGTEIPMPAANLMKFGKGVLKEAAHRFLPSQEPSLGVAFAAHPTLVRKIEKLLTPILSFDPKQPVEFGSFIEKAKDAISLHPQLSLDEKQVALTTLFKWAVEVTRDPNLVESPASFSLPLGEVKESLQNFAPLELKRSEVLEHLSKIANVETNFPFRDLSDVVLGRAIPSLEAVVETAAFMALTNEDAPLPHPKTAILIQEQPIFQAAYEAIRFVIQETRNEALPMEPLLGSEVKNEEERKVAEAKPEGFLLDSRVAVALKMAVALVLVGRDSPFIETLKISEVPDAPLFVEKREEAEVLQPTQKKAELPHAPLTENLLSKANGVNPTYVQPVGNVHFRLDALIQSGTYAQLAMERIFSSFLKPSSFLTELLLPATLPNASFAGVDAVSWVGDRANRNHINSLAPEVVKEQKNNKNQKIEEDLLDNNSVLAV